MNEREEDFAPRTLVEHLRYRVDKHGRDLRELAGYIDSLHPERMDERLKVMRHELDEIKALKPELFGPRMDSLERAMRRLSDSFNRMLLAIVLSCVTIVLTILFSTGKL